MQGQRSSVSALPENLSFDLRSPSVASGTDSQMSWNSMQTSAQNLVPEFRISSTETNLSYMPHARHEAPNGEWSARHSTSSATQNQGEQNEEKSEHSSSIHNRAAVTMEGRQFEPSNIFSFNFDNANLNDNHTANGLLSSRNSSSDALLQDLNMSAGYRNNEDEDAGIVGRPNTYISVGSSNDHMTSSSDSLRLPSGFRGYMMEENENGSGSLDGRRASCKRKVFEALGQSSGAGSSNYYQNVERSQWDTVQSAQIATRNNTISAPIGYNLVSGNRSERSNSRLRIGDGEAVSSGPLSLNPLRTADSSGRNLSLHSSGSHRQDPMPIIPSSTEVDFGSVDVSSSRHSSRLVFRNRLFDSNPPPVVDNGSVHGQSALLQVPFVRRSLQSRWNEVSSSRTNRPFASSPILGERDTGLYDVTTPRNIPSSISDHPIFVPEPERRSSSQYPINWNFASGTNNVAGNVALASRVATSSGLESSPNISYRSSPQYPQRLSEIVRRSLLSSAGTEAGGQSSNLAARTSYSATSQEVALTFGSGSQGQRMSNQRSALWERRRDGSLGVPNSLRVLASASEGRSAIMSEIRRVLDLMRRGEGLRLEDMMILDNSVFFGMADLHDRHRDMRLDVDNMSYEELLALEERIGNVCTGLTEEFITNNLKSGKYVTDGAENPVETEPCSICREEYNEGDNLGLLDCGHDFHKDCIKQWLMLKNLCPICKTTGLNA